MLNPSRQTQTNVKPDYIFILHSYHHLYAVHNDSPAPFPHKRVGRPGHPGIRHTFNVKPEYVIILPFSFRAAVSRIAFCFIEDAANHIGKRLNTR